MLHAYIDESGDRGRGARSSAHFIMAAAVVRDTNCGQINPLLELLRSDLGRSPGNYLTWKNQRTHADRLHISRTLGQAHWLKTAAVVACKRHLPESELNESQIYLYQLRFLLERLSWLGRHHAEVVSYTVAHIKRFEVSALREYEEALRRGPSQIAWEWLDPKGGTIDQPQRNERLQLADLVASATGSAFNADRHGNTGTWRR
jgi:hypothetical protein